MGVRRFGTCLRGCGRGRIDSYSESSPMPLFPRSDYFKHTRQRPDRAGIRDEWIEHVIAHPESEEIQSDGRIRRWARISDFENRALRVSFLRMARRSIMLSLIATTKGKGNENQILRGYGHRSTLVWGRHSCRDPGAVRRHLSGLGPVGPRRFDHGGARQHPE